MANFNKILVWVNMVIIMFDLGVSAKKWQNIDSL